MLELKRVSKTYDGGRTYAVREVSLRIEAGAFWVLLGESGSGKTTVLKMLNRLVIPSAGTILVDGADIDHIEPIRMRRSIGYVIQEIGLFPHMTVAGNVAIVPTLLDWDRKAIRERVDEVLTITGLDPAEYEHRRPAALSGGQRQRVGVARALAARPGIMLMDEPFGALDPITRGELREEFKRIQRTLGLTVVMVTHDITEALLMADCLGVMHEGELVTCGAPHEVMRDESHPYVRSLMQACKEQAAQLGQLTRAGT